jgi:hypothetical protein
MVVVGVAVGVSSGVAIGAQAARKRVSRSVRCRNRIILVLHAEVGIV